jgi:hypothetical protein
VCLSALGTASPTVTTHQPWKSARGRHHGPTDFDSLGVGRSFCKTREIVTQPEEKNARILVETCHCGKVGWTFTGCHNYSGPEQVSNLPIRHFDGLNTFDDLPRDARCRHVVLDCFAYGRDREKLSAATRTSAANTKKHNHDRPRRSGGANLWCASKSSGSFIRRKHVG